MRCAAVIPCLNEAATIGAVVSGVRAHLETVYVVDDGSSDSTFSAAHRAGAEVLKHETNLGKGAALRKGFERAASDGFDCVMMMDGDGQHDPAEIPAFLMKSADLVVGNRMHEAHKMPATRRVVNRWMSAQLSTRLGRNFPDSQCGFRLVRLEAWKGFRLRRQRYEVESEMLVAFARAGKAIEFLPISCLSAPRPSRIRPLLDSIRWFRWWHSLEANYGIDCGR